jgi:hypothetical protein
MLAVPMVLVFLISASASYASMPIVLAEGRLRAVLWAALVLAAMGLNRGRTGAAVAVAAR